MMHHISLTAKNPLYVATVLAEIRHGEVFPFPPTAGVYHTTTFDTQGRLIAVNPQGTALSPDNGHPFGKTSIAKQVVTTQAQTTRGLEYFPTGTLNQLQTLTGLDAAQITNILGMINGPEQSKTEWWQTANGRIIYGYAENIGDGRGVTIGLYGATTKGDAYVIWNEYKHPEYAKLPEKEIIKKVHELANDHRFWKAQWDAYISTYWQPTMEKLKSKGYTKALTIGAVMDTAMNAGTGDDDAHHWGIFTLIKEASAQTHNEKDFLREFLKLRLQHPTEGMDSTTMQKRVAAWQKLLRDQQWDMRIDLKKYAYVPK